MKILFLAMLGVLFVFSNSCKDDDILTQDFNIVLSKSFDVNQADTIISINQLLDAVAESDEISKYSDHIEDFTLEKVTYVLTAFTGPADQNIINATLDVAEKTGANRTNLANISNVNLASLMGNETQLSLNQAGTNLVTAKLGKDPWAINIYFDGNANKGPLDFAVKFRFYIKMKAKII